MPKYIFWQKKEVCAKNIYEAFEKEKKIPYKFDSISEKEDESERELQPLIGFQIRTSDEE